jgi:drug/metabolite transporter superfamily protein YnfA
MSRGRAVASLALEFWDFLRERKKWWLAPIVIVLALFGALIVFTQGSAVAPFIYTIF